MLQIAQQDLCKLPVPLNMHQSNQVFSDLASVLWIKGANLQIYRSQPS